ncbi:MAG: DEAD/DEAH box helicase [Pyrinomonadaceae bacterium]
MNHLERRGIVGALLPDSGSGGNDRFVPRRAIIRYTWVGDSSANTTIQFKVRVLERREAIDRTEANYRITITPSIDWGDDWEDVKIIIPGGGLLTLNLRLDEPHRFRVGISIGDRPEGDLNIRDIVIENLRQRSGIIHAIRVIQENLPELYPIRPRGIAEDILYRASGLVGFLDEANRRLEFSPHALLAEPVRRPVQGQTIDEAQEGQLLSPSTAALFEHRGYSHLYEFQAESITEIKSWLNNGPQAAAILLTVGTAAGKTEAFLMPLLDTLAEDTQHLGVKGVFVYPTKALQTDQARRFFEYLWRFNEGRKYPLSIGILNGDVPWKIDEVSQLERRGEFRSPFSQCPVPGCGGTLMFSIDEQGKDLYAPPRCRNCGSEFNWLRFYQTQIKEHFPTLLLITPDTLHSLLSNKFAWQGQAMLGRSVHVCPKCGTYTAATTKSLSGRRQCTCNEAFQAPVSLCPSTIIFDEAHMLKGMFGSQVSILISRIRRIAQEKGHNPVMIGASATIASPEEFGLQLFGGEVRIIRGREEESDTLPTRYHLFFMPVEVSVLNAVGHTLSGCFVADSDNDEVNRILVFSDAKRTVYQLQATLPEFYATEASLFVEGLFATTRSHTGDLSAVQRRSVELAFDRGEIRVLLATQTLEVGVDFENLPLELQTGATYSYNDYIQRVGRAGRKGYPALVICILRPQIPLDYYYYEHCRELVNFSDDTLDDVPLRSDNPFIIEKHVPAAIQDFLIGLEEGAKLMWFIRDAVNVLTDQGENLRAYLRGVFLPPFALEPDLIESAIETGIRKVQAHLRASVNSGEFTSELLKQHIQLSIRSTDVDITIFSDDFEQHAGISLAGELSDEDFDGPSDDEETLEE